MAKPTHRGWRPDGPQLPRAPHVWPVVHKDGRQGMIKTSRAGNYHRSRLTDEVRGTVDLRCFEGVMPVLDFDDTVPWMVMPRAVGLSDYLGPDATLREVVVEVCRVATTLALMAGNDLYHRDLKPANLFRLGQETVIGDFGLATWPTRMTRTGTGRQVGSAHFMAPGMREYNSELPAGPADVYSLGKTLFGLAMSRKGSYPPLGTHAAGSDEFSLYAAGGQPAHDLAYLLEAMTVHRPHERPGMRTVVTELSSWLARFSPGSVQRHDGRLRGGLFSSPTSQADLARMDRRTTNLQRRLMSHMRSLTKALLGYSDGWTEDGGRYFISPEPDTELEPDDFLALASDPDQNGFRVVLAAALYGDTADIFFQWRRDNDADGVLAFEHQRAADGRLAERTGDARPHGEALSCG